MWHLRIWRDSLLAERLYPNSDAKLQGHRWIRSNWPALELRANSLLLWPELMAQTSSTRSLRLSCVCTPSLWRGFTCESSMTDKFTSFSLNKSIVNWKVVLSFNFSFCDIDMLVDDGSTSPRGFNLRPIHVFIGHCCSGEESVACWNKTGHILRYRCGMNGFFHCWVHWYCTYLHEHTTWGCCYNKTATSSWYKIGHECGAPTK